jgi:hypothetical protein
MMWFFAVIVLGIGLPSTAAAVTIDSDFRPAPIPGMPAPGTQEQAAHQPSTTLIPGDRIILGRVIAIKSQELEVDIGHLQRLYLPLKPSSEKHEDFKVGDPVLVTMNDHNAVVDYHHPSEPSHHQVFKGRLTTPLTVGSDKAVIATDAGTKTFLVAERAKGKLDAIPVGAEVWFLADETGLLVDAQLGSQQAVEESARNNKARLLGAHAQHRAIFQQVEPNGHLRVMEAGQVRDFAVRPPLPMVDQLKAGQEIVLLTDTDGYVLEIATAPSAPGQ